MSFLSHLHTDIRRTRLTRRGATHRAEGVPRGTHKEYPRMERIDLPRVTPLPMSLTDALGARSSSGVVSALSSIKLDEIGMLLGHALGMREDGVRRHYPSGGALFPIETYLVTEHFDGANAGVYHYHPKAHALEYLWGVPVGFQMTQYLSRADDLLPAGFIVFTSEWARSAAKYGDLAYQHALLEAGHMSQNILLAATALGMTARPMAGFNDNALIELLDIDETLESPVHTITLSSSAASSAIHHDD